MVFFGTQIYQDIPPLTDIDDEDKVAVYNKMMVIARKENIFAEKALAFKQFISKKNKQLDPLINAFPILTEEYIKYLTFGVYQLNKQCRTQ